MNATTTYVDLRSLVGKSDIKPTIILIGAALIPAVHRCYGSIEFWMKTAGAGNTMSAAVYMFATAFLLMGVVPLFLIRFAFRESPSDYGLRLGDWKFGLTSTLALAPIIGIALLYPASQTAEIRSYYPFARDAGSSWSAFLLLETSRVFLFYTAWEFFYRGFMLFGLRQHFGAWQALCIQVVPQCLWHIGMPTGELLSSIAGGVLFGVLTLRTGSIFWALILHCFIGLCTDLLVVVTR